MLNVFSARCFSFVVSLPFSQRFAFRFEAFSSWQQLFAVALMALFPAAISGVWQLRPSRMEDRPLGLNEVDIAGVRQASEPLLWVDARFSKDFARGHIRGAISLDPEHWSELVPVFRAVWSPGTRTIIYGTPGDQKASENVAEHLRREFHLSKVQVLRDDWKKW